MFLNVSSINLVISKMNEARQRRVGAAADEHDLIASEQQRPHLISTSDDNNQMKMPARNSSPRKWVTKSFFYAAVIFIPLFYTYINLNKVVNPDEVFESNR